MNRQQARRELERRIASGLPAPSEAPKKLHLQAIRKEPALFQFRGPLGATSRKHIQDMARTVKDAKPLRAVLVWWGGDGWYCIDGHHRLEAYIQGGWDHSNPVPVRTLPGSPVVAMLTALHENAPGKLSMTKQEQTQAAWEMVVTTSEGEASADKIAKASTISERYVFSMRKVKKALLARDPERDLVELSWPKARAEAQGTEAGQDDIDWDAKDLQEAKHMADKLSMHLGSRARERPEVLAMALEIYDTRLPELLKDYWRTHGMTTQDDEEENPDF